jgi:hypothetical protein
MAFDKEKHDVQATFVVFGFKIQGVDEHINDSGTCLVTHPKPWDEI